MWKATLYYNGGFLRENEYEFETEQEAIETIEDWKDEYVDSWKMENAWNDNDSEELFEADYDFEYELDETEFRFRVLY